MSIASSATLPEVFDAMALQDEVNAAISDGNDDTLAACREKLIDLLRNDDVPTEHKGSRENPGLIRRLIARMPKPSQHHKESPQVAEAQRVIDEVRSRLSLAVTNHDETSLLALSSEADTLLTREDIPRFMRVQTSARRGAVCILQNDIRVALSNHWVSVLEDEVDMVETQIGNINDDTDGKERGEAVKAALKARDHAHEALENPSILPKFKGSREDPGRVRIAIDQTHELLVKLNDKNARARLRDMETHLTEAEAWIKKDLSNISFKLSKVMVFVRLAGWDSDELVKPHFAQALARAGLDLSQFSTACARLGAARKWVADTESYLRSTQTKSKGQHAQNKVTRQAENRLRKAGNGKKKG